MTETVVVADFMTELVAQRIIESDDAAAPRAAMHHNTIRVLALSVVCGQLSDQIGMARFSFARRAVDSIVGVVDAMGNQFLADALAHCAGMPASLARIVSGEQGSIWQHHLA